MSGERTEAPTERRREEARRKGQGVGRSHELAQVMTLVAGLHHAVRAPPGRRRRAGRHDADPRRAGGPGHGHRRRRTLVADLGAADPARRDAGAPAGRGRDDRRRRRQPRAAAASSLSAARPSASTGRKLEPDQGPQAARRQERPHAARASALAKLVILAAVSWQVISSRVAAPARPMDGPTRRRDRRPGHVRGIFELGVDHRHPARDRRPRRLDHPAPARDAVHPDDQGGGQARVQGVRRATRSSAPSAAPAPASSPSAG